MCHAHRLSCYPNARRIKAASSCLQSRRQLAGERPPYVRTYALSPAKGGARNCSYEGCALTDLPDSYVGQKGETVSSEAANKSLSALLLVKHWSYHQAVWPCCSMRPGRTACKQQPSTANLDKIRPSIWAAYPSCNSGS